MKLSEISSKISLVDQTSKGTIFYDRYESYFSLLSDQPIRMLELGVHAADSLKVFATYFSESIVVGVDLNTPKSDLSSYRNAIFEEADQRNGSQLIALSDRHAPEGWDIIIDDASHYGAWSKLSFAALYPRLKAGGLYVVEDWQTGYWDDWPDGKRYQNLAVEVLEDHIPPRVPSHDIGMVGFVKSLVDEVADRPVGNRGTHIGFPSKFDWMHINHAFAILKKKT